SPRPCCFFAWCAHKPSLIRLIGSRLTAAVVCRGLEEGLDQFFPSRHFHAAPWEMPFDQGVDPFPRSLDESQFKEGCSLFLPERVSVDFYFYRSRFSD